MLQANAEESEVGSGGTASPCFVHDFSQILLHPKSSANVQAKLTVAIPGDIYEQEANYVVEQVTSISEAGLQHTCACGGGCSKCQTKQLGREHERLQTKQIRSNDLGQTTVPFIGHEVLRSPGQPLDPATRAFMEPRFGHDFSQVGVHSGTAADQSAWEENVCAYTVGHDVVFGAGWFAPESHQGRWLIAHELTHVVQQGSELGRIIPRSGKGEAAHDSYEQEVDRVGEYAIGRHASAATGGARGLLQRYKGRAR